MESVPMMGTLFAVAGLVVGLVTGMLIAARRRVSATVKDDGAAQRDLEDRLGQNREVETLEGTQREEVRAERDELAKDAEEREGEVERLRATVVQLQGSVAELETEIRRNSSQGFVVHERSPQTTEVAFRRQRVTAKYHLGNHEVEYGITKEFETLVVVARCTAMR